MIFRRPRPEPEPREDWSDEYVQIVGERRGVTGRFNPAVSRPWFRTTPVNHAVHNGRMSCRLMPNTGERSERRSRVLPEPPPSTEPDLEQMRFGPWS